MVLGQALAHESYGFTIEFEVLEGSPSHALVVALRSLGVEVDLVMPKPCGISLQEPGQRSSHSYTSIVGKHEESGKPRIQVGPLVEVTFDETHHPQQFFVRPEGYINGRHHISLRFSMQLLLGPLL